MTMTKRTTLELSLDPRYVPSWGMWEALRELLQNAADAADGGHVMEVDRTRSGTVRITSQGVRLTRETLLLGSTSKSDGNSRGRFGEGYKLALAVLARMGRTVTVRSGSELWTPFIEKSTQFGAQVLKILIRPASSEFDGIRFEVEDVTDAEWQQARSRCLFLDGPDMDKVITLNGGRILQAPEYANKLYVRGIYVGMMPDEYAYGYDLDNVQLDRDRRLADPWSLRAAIVMALRDAFMLGSIALDEVTRLIGGASGEARAFEQEYRYKTSSAGDLLAEQMAALFMAEHGDNAVPVSSLDESIQAAQLGLKGVVVASSMRVIIEGISGKLVDRKKRQAMMPVRTYSAHDLSPDELQNFAWACRLINAVEPSGVGDVQVVDFQDPDGINGVFDDRGTVRLARRRLAVRADLISTFVHEVAHKYGGDGTVEHRAAMQRIFAAIITNLN